MSEVNNKKAINAYLSENTIKVLDIIKKHTDLSRNQIISIAVSEYVSSNKSLKELPEIKDIIKDGYVWYK